MPTFHVTTDRPKVPAARFAAEDLVDLGHQVAGHLAQVGDDHGAIHQSGLPRPVTFVIRKES